MEKDYAIVETFSVYHGYGDASLFHRRITALAKRLDLEDITKKKNVSWAFAQVYRTDDETEVIQERRRVWNAFYEESQAIKKEPNGFWLISNNAAWNITDDKVVAGHLDRPQLYVYWEEIVGVNVSNKVLKKLGVI